MLDHLSGTHRCGCGRLYKDFTGLMGKCDKCRSAIHREMREQEARDVLINEIEGESQ